MNFLLKKIFPQLPTHIRHRLVRGMVQIPAEISQDFEFKIAETKEELEAAFHILHDAYVHEKYMIPNPSELRVTKYHALPTTTTLIAKFQGRTVGTISIIRNSGMGLPLDAAYDLTALRLKFGQIAEVSSLAIQKEFRAEHGTLLWPLLKFFYHYARNLMRLRAIVIGVHPKWSDFYMGIMGFRRLHAETIENYEFANGNPVTGFYLDLDMAPLEYSTMYSDKPTESNLLKFFTSPCSPNFRLPPREFYKVADSVMTPELLDYFFCQKTKILESLSAREAQTVLGSYPMKEYGLVLKGLPKIIEYATDREIRFKVNCRALIPDDSNMIQLLEVVSVSAGGVEIRRQLPQGIFDLKVQIGDSLISELTIERVWSKNGYSGGKILRASSEWFDFVEYLKQDFDEKNPAKSSEIKSTG